MIEQIEQVEQVEQTTEADVDVQSPAWGDGAPRGGKAVFSRMTKENSTVPLFFGQTLISSLRDMGYNSATSALCEHVDNAIQWGATEVRVYFRQTGKRGTLKSDVLVLDNGQGMAPNILKLATSFGGSMVFASCTGIGRYGMGMKTAALSMSPIMDLYSWQEPGGYYNMVLDVEAIGKERANLIELPEPVLMDQLPSEVADILTKPMVFPDKGDQDLFIDTPESLRDRLGKAGTIVYLPDCDRLTSATARTLCTHAITEMSRVYRRFLVRGTKLYINNRLVQPFDPTYSMPTARHTTVPEISIKESRLRFSKVVDVPRSEIQRGADPVEGHHRGRCWSRLQRNCARVRRQRRQCPDETFPASLPPQVGGLTSDKPNGYFSAGRLTPRAWFSPRATLAPCFPSGHKAIGGPHGRAGGSLKASSGPPRGRHVCLSRKRPGVGFR